MVELDVVIIGTRSEDAGRYDEGHSLEQRGGGRSDPSGPYDIETCLADLENIRNYYNVDRWIIGGHSWRRLSFGVRA